MQSKLPVYFLWSQDYSVFASVLKQGIKFYPDFLEDKSIFVDQSEFNKHIYKETGKAYFNGCWFKVQTCYHLLQTLPEGSYFLFSDADIIFFPNKRLEDLFRLYMNIGANLVFMRDAPKINVANCGFILIKVCQENRDLWKNVLELAASGKASCEQGAINGFLKTYSQSVFFFPHEFVATTCTLREGELERESNVFPMRNQMMVFQALVDPTKDKKNVILQKVDQYQKLGIPVNVKFE